MIRWTSVQRFTVTKAILTDSLRAQILLREGQMERIDLITVLGVLWERSGDYFLYYRWRLTSVTYSETLDGRPRFLAGIVPLSTLEAVGIPQERKFKQPIEVSGFRGNSSFTLSFTNLDLPNEPMWTANWFHVIDAWTTYHLLLGRPWSINTKLSPPLPSMLEDHLERK